MTRARERRLNLKVTGYVQKALSTIERSHVITEHPATRWTRVWALLAEADEHLDQLYEQIVPWDE